MKVLFWSFAGFDKHTTSEHLLISVLEQLCKSGHSVHLIQKNTGGNLSPIPESLQGLPITTDTVAFTPANKVNFIARYLNDISYINNSIKIINADYDAIFIQSSPLSGIAVKRIRRRLPNSIITLNVQDIFPLNAVYSGKIKFDGILYRLLSKVQNIGYSISDHIITISSDMKTTLVSFGVKEDKIETIYNWSYQDGLYSNLDYSPIESMFNNAYCNIVYAGNIGIMQNVDILIEAARLMKNDPSVWFHIIGDGVYKKKAEQKVKDYQIDNISFWPMQSPHLAPLIYSRADINIIPLIKNVYKTALPSKTATCLACNKPIIFAIGKDSLFGKEVAKWTSCPVVDSDDPYELINAIDMIRKSNNIDTKNYYETFFSKTINSRQYAQIIVSGQ